MLHTDGSHAGLSDEDHSTFRVRLALITGRAFAAPAEQPDLRQDGAPGS
jgi:hypothetical protein